MDGVLFDLPGDSLWEMLGISLATVLAHHLFLRWRYLSRLDERQPAPLPPSTAASRTAASRATEQAGSPSGVSPAREARS